MKRGKSCRGKLIVKLCEMQCNLFVNEEKKHSGLLLWFKWIEIEKTIKRHLSFVGFFLHFIFQVERFAKEKSRAFEERTSVWKEMNKKSKLHEVIYGANFSLSFLSFLLVPQLLGGIRMWKRKKLYEKWQKIILKNEGKKDEKEQKNCCLWEWNVFKVKLYLI